MLEKKVYANGQAVYVQTKDTLTYYYKNGVKKAEGPYINGLMEGEWIFYRENGDLWQVGHFKNNTKHGNFIRYNKSRKVEYNEDFDSGKLIPKKRK